MKKSKSGKMLKAQATVTVHSPHKSVLNTISKILMDAELVSRYATVHPNGSIWCIKYGGNIQAGGIVKWLYEDATISLDRKKLKADAIITNK